MFGVIERRRVWIEGVCVGSFSTLRDAWGMVTVPLFVCRRVPGFAEQGIRIMMPGLRFRLRALSVATVGPRTPEHNLFCCSKSPTVA